MYYTPGVNANTRDWGTSEILLHLPNHPQSDQRGRGDGRWMTFYILTNTLSLSVLKIIPWPVHPPLYRGLH